MAKQKEWSNHAKAHLNMLVQLARVDGVVVQDEIELITKVGVANGLSAEEISDSFDNPEHIGDLSGLSDDEKYDSLYNIVQLMKIDGRLYKEEIKFCAKIASRLGYKENVLMELMLKIYSDPHITTDRHVLKEKVQQYLIRN